MCFSLTPNMAIYSLALNCSLIDASMSAPSCSMKRIFLAAPHWLDQVQYFDPLSRFSVKDIWMLKNMDLLNKPRTLTDAITIFTEYNGAL